MVSGGINMSVTSTTVYTVSRNYSNLEEFLKMKEVFKTIQLVTCSLAINVSSISK